MLFKGLSSLAFHVRLGHLSVTCMTLAPLGVWFIWLTTFLSCLQMDFCCLKSTFLSSLPSAKRVSELHGLSYNVKHSREWTSCTFYFMPEFIANTQNLSVLDLHFDKSFLYCLIETVDGDRDRMLLCPFKVKECYLSRIEQYYLYCSSLFIFTGCRKMVISRNMISLWIIAIINKAFEMAYEEDCKVAKAEAYKVWEICSSLLFKNICNPTCHVGWSMHVPNLFNACCVRDAPHHSVDTLHMTHGSSTTCRVAPGM